MERPFGRPHKTPFFFLPKPALRCWDTWAWPLGDLEEEHEASDREAYDIHAFFSVQYRSPVELRSGISHLKLDSRDIDARERQSYFVLGFVAYTAAASENAIDAPAVPPLTTPLPGGQAAITATTRQAYLAKCLCRPD